MEKTNLDGKKAIDWAIVLGCAESVRQLLKAGCSFDIDEWRCRPHNVLDLAVALFRGSARGQRDPSPNSALPKHYFEIVKIIIEELASRTFVPIVEKTSDVPDSNPIMKSGSVGAENSVRSSLKSVSHTESILSPMNTVYHCPYLTVEVANELWSAGFRGIDTPDEFLMTPLMAIALHDYDIQYNNINDAIEYAFWLYQKGASLCRLQSAKLHPENSNAGENVRLFEPLAIHFVAAAFIFFVVREAESYFQYYVEKHMEPPEDCFPERVKPLIDDLSLDCQHFLHKIMVDTSPDGCICACSRHGCLPSTYFLKREYDWYYCGEEKRRYFSKWRLLWLFDNVPSEQISNIVFNAIVRLMTFERLGLRHTCCRRTWYSRTFLTIDAEEAAEIRDEDRKGIQLLESLLLKFKENYDDRDLKTWLDEYWKPEMEEILAARDREVHDEAGLREAGVVLCEDDGISDQDWGYE